MYRRLAKNPNYYEIAGRTSQHINDYLSELVEDCTAELAESGSLAMAENEIDLEIANLGRIASYYCLSYQTIEVFARSFASKSEPNASIIKLPNLLQIICQCSEITNAVQNINLEEIELRKLALNLPIDIDRREDFCAPHVIANILV